MALADDIRELRDRALVELVAAHDYYTNTKRAWRVVLKVIRAGQKLTIRNSTTGTVTKEPQLVLKAHDYVVEDLAYATFQQFVSIFENFLFDLLRAWLTAYPRSLGSKELLFSTVLDEPDKESITLHVVNKELNELAYDRPSDWFAYLESRAKLGCPAATEIERVAEAKATRDILAHNRGVANKTYETKAGTAARFKDGQKIEIPERYHREMWELFRKVITDMSAAAEAKVA
jgi:hypothetical protein